MMKLPEFFVTTIPVCLTSLGSCPVADCTAFCTSVAAMSRFVPSANVHVIVLVPLFALVEEMYRRPSTPFTACSSGVVTADSTACALAPL